MTVIGRIVTMISSFFGIAVVALPAGIITSGLMEEVQQSKEQVNGTLEDRDEK